jgi:hypothetical protein
LDFSKLRIYKAAIISWWAHNSSLCRWLFDTSQPIARLINTHNDCPPMSLLMEHAAAIAPDALQY